MQISDTEPFLYLGSFQNIFLLCKVISKARDCSKTGGKKAVTEVREGWTQMLQQP